MGVNQSLCLDSEGNPTYSWCLYQAIDNYTFIVECAFMASLIMIFVVVLRYILILNQIFKRQKLKEMLYQDTTTQVFALIFTWLLLSITKVTINIVIYQLYMKQDFELNVRHVQTMNDRHSSQPIVVLSAVFYVLDYLCPCFLLYLIFFVPFKWLKSALQNTNQNKDISYQLRIRIETFFRVLSIFDNQSKIFILVYVLVMISYPFLLYFTSFGCHMPSYIVYLIYFQSFVVLIFYIFGLYTINFMRRQELVTLSAIYSKRIVVEYFLLMSAVIIRIGLNYYFKLSNLYQYKPNINCTDIENRVKASICLSILSFIMHQLPIITTIYIYKPSKQIRVSLDQAYMGLDVDRCTKQQYHYSFTQSLRCPNMGYIFKSQVLSGQKYKYQQQSNIKQGMNDLRHKNNNYDVKNILLQQQDSNVSSDSGLKGKKRQQLY